MAQQYAFTYRKVDVIPWREALRFHSDNPNADRFIAHGVIDDPLIGKDGSRIRSMEGSIPKLEWFLELIAQEPESGRAHCMLFTQTEDGRKSGALRVEFDFDGQWPVVTLQASDQVPQARANAIVAERARSLEKLPGVERVPPR